MLIDQKNSAGRTCGVNILETFYSVCLSLAELRSATSRFEAVFLTLFHSRVAGEITGLLQDGTVIRVCLEQSSRDAVADSSCLSGIAAAAYIHQYVELIYGLGGNHRLTHDNLQGLQSEILVNASLVNGNISSAGYQVHSGD